MALWMHCKIQKNTFAWSNCNCQIAQLVGDNVGSFLLMKWNSFFCSLNDYNNCLVFNASQRHHSSSKYDKAIKIVIFYYSDNKIQAEVRTRTWAYSLIISHFPHKLEAPAKLLPTLFLYSYCLARIILLYLK